jgi:hypothetical protein
MDHLAGPLWRQAKSQSLTIAAVMPARPIVRLILPLSLFDMITSAKTL